MYLEYVFLALICLIKVVELKVLETEVVILGAGASGISAAQTLFKKVSMILYWWMLNLLLEVSVSRVIGSD